MDIYDDIVVGAGSAGAVLASRLSEDPWRRVLLIEAGPDYASPDAMPKSILSALTPARDHDWRFTAEMVPGRSMDYARGKVIGGSSSVNACLALRGLPSDYDEWAALGNTEWSWGQVQPVFRAIERDVDIDDEHHGRHGPIEVRRHPLETLTPGQAAFYEACKELGFPVTRDHNNPASTGVGAGPWNIDANGRRISTAIAYLQAARTRHNLTILSGTLVDRVLIEAGQVVGVDVLSPRGLEQLRSQRVCLSGGTIGTPAVLLRSGIGNPADIAALGITPFVDRPGVGRNLVEHARAGVAWDALPGFVDAASPYLQVLCRYTAPTSTRSNDMQLMLFQMLPQPALSVRAELMKPLSVGRLTLRSPDPTVQPDIRLNLLSAPEDMRRMVEGLRLIGRLLALPRMAQIGATQLMLDDGDRMATADWARRLTDDTWAADYARRAVRHYVHPVGTARMGAAGDPDAVVDQHGRVHGVRGLRVADASIMPTVPSANTNLACIMIGERIAAWMRSERG